VIVTVQLEEHDVLAAGGDTWPITRAILEAIEPGAGGHCVARIHTEAGRRRLLRPARRLPLRSGGALV
jgi:hypothetical protein